MAHDHNEGPDENPAPAPGLRTDFGLADLHQIILGARKAVMHDKNVTGLLLENHGLMTAALVSSALRGVDPEVLLKVFTEAAKIPEFKDH